MSETAPALSARHLTKHYGTAENPVPVLNDLSLEVGPGRFEAVMGPSGSGKSTLLHLLAGLITPDSGSIRIGGTEITAMSDRDLTCFRRRKIGLIFQDFNLIPTLSVEENIVLPLLLDGRKPDPAKAGRLLATLGIEARRAFLPEKLSGGERQRVAIARALMGEPAILLADEPTGNLDSKAGRTFCRLLREVNAETRCAILMVSHDPVTAAAADSVHFMKDGAFVGTLGPVPSPEALSAAYIEHIR